MWVQQQTKRQSSQPSKNPFERLRNLCSASDALEALASRDTNDAPGNEMNIVCEGKQSLPQLKGLCLSWAALRVDHADSPSWETPFRKLSVDVMPVLYAPTPCQGRDGRHSAAFASPAVITAPNASPDSSCPATILMPSRVPDWQSCLNIRSIS